MIPDPSRVHYPMNLLVLLHLVGPEIGIKRTPEVLGIQGKRKTVRRKLAQGAGLGGTLKLNARSYSYKGVGAGFAENDLEEFDGAAAGVAWTRTVGALREGFGVRVEVEAVRDRFVEGELPVSSPGTMRANR